MSKKKTVIQLSLIAIILAFTLTVNILCTTVFDSALRFFVGGSVGAKTVESELEDFNKAGASKADVTAAAQELVTQIAHEGIVLLKYDRAYMPYDSGNTTFSFFSKGCAYIKMFDAFEQAGFGVNPALKDFYTVGTGSQDQYKRGGGPVDFGAAMNYELNEVPLSVLEKEPGLLDSCKGTTPVFVMSRTCGEGVDPVRAMYTTTYDRKEAKTTASAADYDKSYQEPSSEELEILEYLNNNFSDVVLIINSTNPVEAGFIEQYSNIHNVLLVPNVGSGINAIPAIMKGDVNPSGRLVDTYPYDSLSSAAAQNVGDFVYYDRNGKEICNYISYQEGIYVGYRYFETRYEDVVLGQGNPGEYDYASAVQFPFGYGLSYTQFMWSDFSLRYDPSAEQFIANVTITNTGDMAGKDVFQLYAQKPYTDYDRDNSIEKASVELVGFAKTRMLAPGEAESLTVFVPLEYLRTYDSFKEKTYIMEAGPYYFTAAANAHEAVNNILLKKGADADALVGPGCAEMALMTDLSEAALNFENGIDSEKYARDSMTGADITNQFDYAKYDGMVFLSRSNWAGTFPAPDGEIDTAKVSGWGNTINGVDSKGNPTSYIVFRRLTDEQIALYNARGKEASLNTDAEDYSSYDYVFSAGKDVELFDLRGKSYDDPLWEELLNNMSDKDFTKLLTQAYYGTVLVDSVKKPETKHADSATGLIGSKLGIKWMAIPVLSQTYNPELSYAYGNVIGQDSLRTTNSNIHLNGWYAPGVNLHRTAYTGRSGEYYSEDPILTGIFASQTIRGAAKYGLITFIKHFAVNEQELHRGDKAGENGIVTWANEQSIRELYLKPFEMAMKCRTVEQFYYDGNTKETYETPACGGVMTSFNRLGFTWAGGCYNLIASVLRGEWGFNGMVVTDYDNGGYMDTEQSLYAGSSAKLNLINTCNWSLDTGNKKEVAYAREAAHQILFSEVNSSGMNGVSRGIIISRGFPVYGFILIALDVAALVGITVIVLSKKKQAQKERRA